MPETVRVGVISTSWWTEAMYLPSFESHPSAEVAAICAAPIALASAGILEGRTVTSYPSFASQLTATQYSEDRVCIDGHITTSRAPGTRSDLDPPSGALGLR